MTKFYRENRSPIMVRGTDGTTVDAYRGALNIHDADVHNEVVNREVHQHTATATTLAVTASPEDYQITVASAVGFAVGDYIHINTTTVELTHPRITAIAGNVLTLDRRLDYAHSIGDTVTKVLINMNAIGTMAAPQIFYAAPSAGEIWHITRMMFELTHGTAGDLGLFGDLPALTNGVVLRVSVGGVYTTFTNWKQNSHMKTDMYDVQFDPRSGGGGAYGTTGRGTFTNAGAVLRLDGDLNDSFEVFVQDDLSGLTSFTMKVQGHFEGL